MASRLINRFGTHIMPGSWHQRGMKYCPPYHLGRSGPPNLRVYWIPSGRRTKPGPVKSVFNRCVCPTRPVDSVFVLSSERPSLSIASPVGISNTATSNVISTAKVQPEYMIIGYVYAVTVLNAVHCSRCGYRFRPLGQCVYSMPSPPVGGHRAGRLPDDHRCGHGKERFLAVTYNKGTSTSVD